MSSVLVAQDSGTFDLNLINDSSQFSMGRVVVSVHEKPDWITVTPSQFIIDELGVLDNETASFDYTCEELDENKTGSVILKAIAATGDVLYEEYAVQQGETTNNQILIAMDRSMSMADRAYWGTQPPGYNTWNVTRLALMDLINYMNIGDAVGMIDFGLHPTKVIDRTVISSNAAKYPVINELSVSGGLGINNALVYYNTVGAVYGYTSLGNLFDTAYDTYPDYTDVYTMIAQEYPVDTTVHVILVTDGMEQQPPETYNPDAYRSTFHKIKDVSASVLRANNICLHAVVIDEPWTVNSSHYDDTHGYLYQLAMGTGGTYHYVPRVNYVANVQAGILDAYNQIVFGEPILNTELLTNANSPANQYVDVTVDASMSEVRFSMLWAMGEGSSGNNHKLELIKPDGTIITSSTTVSNISYNAMMSSVDSGVACFDINAPEAGLWQAKIKRDTSMSFPQDDISLSVTAKASLKMNTSFNYGIVNYQDEPKLQVNLVHNASGFEYANVSVTVNYQYSNVSNYDWPMSFELDNSGAGKYTLPLNLFNEKGYYSFDIAASDDNADFEFLRTKTLNVSINEKQLSPPENVSITQENHNITISWNAVDGARVYYVWGAETTSGEFTKLTPIGTLELEYTVHTNYPHRFFRVVAATN